MLNYHFAMSRSQPEFRDEHIPFGYLITFRAYGTWLHGRGGSVDRFHNVYGEPKLPANEQRRQYNQRLLAQHPVKLGTNARTSVEKAVRETCEIRKWSLWAFNIRTNHVHTVVSANAKPEQVLSAFKANATRMLREAGLWRSERSLWARKGSKRYLWTEQDLFNAIAYVMYDQGEPLP
jgi:REP element-mobilizing transposase RayT